MRMIVLPAILVIAAHLSGAAWAQPAVGIEIAPQGKLRVATIGANPALIVRKPEGSFSGVSVDLGRFVAERLGVTFEPVVYADPVKYTQSFGTGEWDIAIGPRDIGGDSVDFSPDFMLVDNVYVAAPGRAFADAGQVDRPGVKIAVVEGGAPAAFLSRTLKSARLVPVGGRDAAIEALRSGRADLFGSNSLNVQVVADRLPGSTIVPGAFVSVHMAVALPRGRSAAARGKLAEIVDEAKRTGVVGSAIEQAGLKGVRVAPQ